MLLLFLFLGQSVDLLTEHPALCCSGNSISFREPNGADGEIRDASRAMFQIAAHEVSSTTIPPRAQFGPALGKGADRVQGVHIQRPHLMKRGNEAEHVVTF